MKESFWERFTQTGRVEDYLSYKGMEICQNVMEKHKEEQKKKMTEKYTQEQMKGG